MINSFNFGYELSNVNNKKTNSKKINSKKKTDIEKKKFNLRKSKAMSGDKNFFYGKTSYSVLVDKYGKELADIKYKEIKLKLSVANRGSNNPMYGKPSPQGSGNGWSGWYKTWYFRSLKELSYMINVIERFNIKWISGEKKHLRIPYKDYDGNNRTYSADFLLNDKYLIEIKPKHLWNSIVTNIKRDSAIDWCKDKGYIYKIIDCDSISSDKIIKLYKQKKIKFLDRYDIKFKEKFLE